LQEQAVDQPYGISVQWIDLLLLLRLLSALHRRQPRVRPGDLANDGFRSGVRVDICHVDDIMPRIKTGSIYIAGHRFNAAKFLTAGIDRAGTVAGYAP
jgi:hypothetical protein